MVSFIFGALALLWTKFTIGVTPQLPAFHATATTTVTNHAVLDLRIQPLGDSITWGFASSDGNGYRLDLETSLSSAGYTVQYIGSEHSGSMTNNSNEGHPGAIITQIASFAKLTLSQLPNVVLLMAGTNDMKIEDPTNPGTAPNRLGALIDQIVAAIPDAGVLVAQLIPSTNNGTESNIFAFNAAIPGVVAARAGKQEKVMVVDMPKYVTINDLADELHPNDHGYAQIAAAWFDSIKQASSNGWIVAPRAVNATTISARTACADLVQWNSRGLVATGAGVGDTAFKSGWTSFGIVAAGGVGKGTSQGSSVHLADINGDGLADYLWVDPTSGVVTAYLNGGIKSDGSSVWKSMGVIATGVGVELGSTSQISTVMVALIISGFLPPGTAWINGNGTDSLGTYKWSSKGVIATGLGGTRDTIRFADIDGDGRADYINVGPTGNLTAFLNYGSGAIPSWQALGSIAGGLGYSDAAGVQLFDVNGDKRSDYLWISPTGAVTAYLNELGTEPKLTPNWTSVGIIAAGVGANRSQILFADLTGDGKVDYVAVAPDTGALSVWVNTGSGGSFEAGAEVYFADINGDGKYDYVALDPSGKASAWFNGGTASDGTIIWDSKGVIAGGVGKPRSQIHFADLDGDGLDDYLTVDPITGAVAMWRNGGGFDSSGTYRWISAGNVAAGVGAGAGIIFADIDGDGRDDYVWLDSNGAASLWVNGGPNTNSNGYIWTSKGKITTGVGATREDVYLTDINGDGKADYLWVDRLTGETKMWKNGGVGSDGNWIWTAKGTIAAGVGTNGLVVKFADLMGTGRSDYLNVVPFSSGVTMWANGCDKFVGSSSSASATPTATAGGGQNNPTPTSTRSSATSTGKSGSGGLGNLRPNPVLGIIVAIVVLEFSGFT